MLALKQRPVAWGLVLLSLLVAIPVFLVEMPPLMDVPNHLVRLWLLDGAINTPPLDRFYAENWQHIGTNIAIDIIAKPFAEILPPFLVGKLLIVLSMLLPPLGAIALNAAVSDGLKPWQFVFLFFWCTITMLAGFLNFQIGLGAALLAAATDLRLRRMPRWALQGGRIVLGVLLIVIHAFALLFYAALLAGIAFGPALPKLSVPDWRAPVLRGLGAAIVCLVPIALFFAWSGGLPGGGGPPGGILYNTPYGTIRSVFSPFISYDTRIDGVFFASFVALGFFALRIYRISFHAGLAVAAIGLLIVSLFMPMATPQASWLDRRIPIMTVLTALSALRLTPKSSRGHETIFGAAAFALVALRTAFIGWAWINSAPLLASVHQALADVPAGATVMPMQHRAAKPDSIFSASGRLTIWNQDSFLHYPALAVAWRHVFVPVLFAEMGKQPIRVRPPWDQVSSPVGGGDLPSVHALENPDLATGDGQRYVRQWHKFDFILVLNADRPDRNGPFAMPPDVRLVKDAGFAQLFRIVK